jgi:cytochrome P450
MITFVLAMVLHPEVARKAQEELDTVIGHGRLPEISDKPSLPYANAILKEVLR